MNRLYFFLQQFKLTAKLSRKQRVSSYPFSPYTQPSSPSAQWYRTYATNEKPIVSQNSYLHLVSFFTLYNLVQHILYSNFVQSFDKYIIICVHHYNTLQSSFTGPKFLCSAYSSPLPLKPLGPLIFLPFPYSCLFQDVIWLILHMQPFKLTSSPK